jgi:hypothetical protein
MTVSFKQFATQYLNLKLPVKASAAASDAGFTTRPISLKEVIASAAPFRPNTSKVPLLNCSNNTDPGPGGGPPQVIFSWVDDANYGSPPSNPRRQATSWQLTVWEAATLHPKGTVPVINQTISLKDESGGVVTFTYVDIQLHGEYNYQITANNDYGSASTGVVGPVAITEPNTSPNIKVTYAGGSNAEFTITGSGFTPGGNVKIMAWASGNGGWGDIVTITASPQGTISTFQYCSSICKQAGGGSLQFTATDLATNAQANQANETCPV